MSQLKQLVYPSNIASPVLPGVRYVIRDGVCYFKGGFGGGRRSTINAAEDILTAVSVQEDVSLHELRFVDVQANAVDELEFRVSGEEVMVSAWKPTLLPPEITQLFQPESGGLT